jgi:hypothetical protein
MNPEEFRPMLRDLLCALQRVSRHYRCTVLYAPGGNDFPGWGKLCELTEQTAEQTRRVLHTSTTWGGMDCELSPPEPPTVQEMANRIRLRRAVDAPRPRPSGMSAGRTLH